MTPLGAQADEEYEQFFFFKRLMLEILISLFKG